MRYFIIETRHDTGRKHFSGLSVRTRYVAERDLAKRTANPGRALAIESYPTVTAAVAAIHAHNEPLPFTAPKAKTDTGYPYPSVEGEDGQFYPLEG